VYIFIFRQTNQPDHGQLLSHVKLIKPYRIVLYIVYYRFLDLGRVADGDGGSDRGTFHLVFSS